MAREEEAEESPPWAAALPEEVEVDWGVVVGSGALGGGWDEVAAMLAALYRSSLCWPACSAWTIEADGADMS